jgi:hypothetical protein
VFPLAGAGTYPVRIEAIVLSGEVDPELTVYNSSGDILAHSNHGSLRAPEVIGHLQFPIDGYYELSVQSVTGDGEIGVAVYRLDPKNLAGGGTFTSSSQQLTGTMRQPQSYHTYTLPLERGKRVDIVATALTPGLHLSIELYGPSASLLEDPGNIYSGANPSIWHFMPAMTGDYKLILSNEDEHTGDYTIDVRPSSGGEQAELSRRATLDFTEQPANSIWLSLTGEALDGVAIRAETQDRSMDIAVAVYDPFGNQLMMADIGGGGQTEEITFVQFPINGLYQIRFASSGPGQASYVIRPVRQVDIMLGGRIYPGGRSEKGDIMGPNMFIAYEFDGEAGTSIGVDAHATGGTGLDLGFDLYNPDGSLLISRDDTVGKDPVLDRIELSQSGRYVLALWNFSDTTGPFEVFVTTPESPAQPALTQPQ